MREVAIAAPHFWAWTGCFYLLSFRMVCLFCKDLLIIPLFFFIAIWTDILGCLIKTSDLLFTFLCTENHNKVGDGLQNVSTPLDSSFRRVLAAAPGSFFMLSSVVSLIAAHAEPHHPSGLLFLKDLTSLHYAVGSLIKSIFRLRDHCYGNCSTPIYFFPPINRVKMRIEEREE